MENTVLFEAQSAFSVPCVIVDQHLNAPDVELRLILLLLRNTNVAFYKSDLLNALQVDEARLEDAFQYWVKNNILFRTAGKYTLQRPKLATSDFLTYRPETIAKRLETDSALQYLYQSAEEALNKPLTSADASLILSLVDWCGLPAEVVALLIRYGGENGKSLRQIAQTGVRWADDGVKTFEQAEERIRREAEKKQAVNRIAARLGILGTRALTEKERETFLKWSEAFGFSSDMVGAAYEETVRNTGKYTYTYMDKILTKWHEAGYTTPEQTAAAPKPAAKKPATRRTANNPKKPAVNSDAMDLAWQIATGNDES